MYRNGPVNSLVQSRSGRDLLYLIVRGDKDARRWLVTNVTGLRRRICHPAKMPNIDERHRDLPLFWD